MLIHIARRQILDCLVSPRFLAAAILCIGVGVGAAIVRVASYERHLRDYRLVHTESRKEASGYTHPGPLTYDGVTVVRPPSLMAIFYAGLEPDAPYSVRITANRDPVVESQYERSNPLADLFQTLDFSTFVAFVISVLAVAIGYDAVSGEKERGTLRLLLSYPVTRHSVLLGKWIGGLAALGIPVLATALCSLLVVVLSPEANLHDGHVAAFVALTGASLLYVGAVYSIALFISCATHRSFTTVTILVSIWVALAVGVPSVSPYAARTLSPTDPAHLVEGKKWAAISEENQARYNKIIQWRRTAPSDPVKQMEFYSEVFRESFMNTAGRQEQIHAEFTRRLSRQTGLAAALSRLSPVASYIYAAGDLADTGLEDWERFRRSLQAYRTRFLNYAEDKWLQQARDGGGPISTDDHPRFVYHEPGTADRVHAALPDLGLLAAWSVVLFAASWVAFLRYDPR